MPAKSPVPGVDPVVAHSPFDPHHRGATPEVYRSHLPPHLDPAMPFHRALDPGKSVCVLALFVCFLEILCTWHRKDVLIKLLVRGRYNLEGVIYTLLWLDV